MGGGARYNSDSRKGAVLVCIYLIKDITDLKEPCRSLRQGSFYLPVFEQESNNNIKKIGL